MAGNCTKNRISEKYDRPRAVFLIHILRVILCMKNVNS